MFGLPPEEEEVEAREGDDERILSCSELPSIEELRGGELDVDPEADAELVDLLGTSGRGVPPNDLR